MFGLKKKKTHSGLAGILTCQGFYQHVKVRLHLSDDEILRSVLNDPGYSGNKRRADIMDLITVTRNAIESFG